MTLSLNGQAVLRFDFRLGGKKLALEFTALLHAARSL